MNDHTITPLSDAEATATPVRSAALHVLVAGVVGVASFGVAASTVTHASPTAGAEPTPASAPAEAEPHVHERGEGHDHDHPHDHAAEPSAEVERLLERAETTGLTRIGTATLGDPTLEAYVPTEWLDSATDGDVVEVVDVTGEVIAYFVMDVGLVSAADYETPGFDLRTWVAAVAPDPEKALTEADENGGFDEPATFSTYVDPETADFEGAWD